MAGEAQDQHGKAYKHAHRVDPEWPDDSAGHPVTELLGDRQGSLSPFGELEFPVPAESLPYVHPVTVINR
jgi:hypothetical protein